MGGAEVGISPTSVMVRVGKILPAEVDEEAEVDEDGAKVGVSSTSAPKAAKLGKNYVAKAPENKYDYTLF